MSFDFYVLECAAETCFAEIYLNDIPVILRGPGIGMYFDGPVNQLLVDGVNRISLLIRPGETPAESRTGTNGEKVNVQPKGDKAFARIVGYPFGALSGGPEGQELLRVDWNGHEEDSFDFPMEVSAEANLGPLFGGWAWQVAPKLELDEATRASVHEFLGKARADLEAFDAEAHIQRCILHLRELGRAYDTRASKKMNLIRMALEEDSKKAGFGFEELDPETYSLRLIAGGRMIECIGKDWEPLIREKPSPEGDSGSYEMRIAKVDGEWAVVR